MTNDLEPGSIIGKPRTAMREEDHFMKCGFCNGWMDCRDLGGVFAHPPYPHEVPVLSREQ